MIVNRCDRALSRELLILFALAIASAALYAALYFYGDSLSHMAKLARQGQHTYFGLPIMIALLFSVVHGAFTDRFWTALGVRARSA